MNKGKNKWLIHQTPVTGEVLRENPIRDIQSVELLFQIEIMSRSSSRLGFVSRRDETARDHFRLEISRRLNEILSHCQH